MTILERKLERLTENFAKLSLEYQSNFDERGVSDDKPEDELEKLIEDFALRASRLIHLGEVSYKDKDNTDTLCLAVRQTFKIEKTFFRNRFGLYPVGCSYPPTGDNLKTGNICNEYLDHRKQRPFS